MHFTTEKNKNKTKPESIYYCQRFVVISKMTTRGSKVLRKVIEQG